MGNPILTTQVDDNALHVHALGAVLGASDMWHPNVISRTTIRDDHLVVVVTLKGVGRAVEYEVWEVVYGAMGELLEGEGTVGRVAHTGPDDSSDYAIFYYDTGDIS